MKQNNNKFDGNRIRKIYKKISPIFGLFYIVFFFYLILISFLEPETINEVLNNNRSWFDLTPIYLLKKYYINNNTPEMIRIKSFVNTGIAIIIIGLALNYVRKRVKKDNKDNNITV